VRYSIPGDFAQVLADGSIHLLGRGSVCINSGGEKIFPEEVEESLKTHDAVRDAVVVGIPHPTFGEQIVAVVELSDDAGAVAPSEAELIDHVKSRLASYKAPRRVRVVDTIGRAPNGKVDYKRHRDESIAELQSGAGAGAAS
jgi:fatty-acyl-CoA synthase